MFHTRKSHLAQSHLAQPVAISCGGASSCNQISYWSQCTDCCHIVWWSWFLQSDVILIPMYRLLPYRVVELVPAIRCHIDPNVQTVAISCGGAGSCNQMSYWSQCTDCCHIVWCHTVWWSWFLQSDVIIDPNVQTVAILCGGAGSCNQIS